MWRRGIKMGSMRQVFIAALALAAIGLAAYAFFEAGFYRPDVTAWGQVTVSDATGKFRVTAATRRLAIGRQTSGFWQVEISPGDWRDCGSDCAAALRKAAFP